MIILMILLAVASPASKPEAPLAKARITGRVVGPDGETPAGGTEVRGRVEGWNPTFSSDFELSAVTDAAGQFQLELRSVPAHRVVLVMESGPANGSSIRSVNDVGRSGLDIGTVRLEPRRSIPFLVRDSDEKPIVGAVAVAADATRRRSNATSPNGLGTLDGLAEQTKTIFVTREGYWPEPVLVPDRIEEPLVVDMTACNSLEVRIRKSGGENGLSNLGLSLTSRLPLFPSTTSLDANGSLDYRLEPDKTTEEWEQAPLGGSGGDIDDTGATLSVGFGTEVVGDFARAYLPCIRAGVPFNIEVGDNAWSTLSRESVSLGPREHRVIEASVDRPADRKIIGRVFDKLGNPVAGAGVGFPPPPSECGCEIFVLGSTSDDGRFERGGIAADTVSFFIQKEGLASAFFQAFPLSDGVNQVDVVLEPELRVLLTLVTEDRRQVPRGTAIVETPGGNRITGGTLRDSRIEFTGLSKGKLLVKAFVGAREFVEEHDASQSQLLMVIPAFGSISARVPDNLPQASAYRLVLENRDGEREKAYLPLGFDDQPDERGWCLFPVVFEGRHVLRLEASHRAEEPYRSIAVVPEVMVTPGEHIDVVIPQQD